MTTPRTILHADMDAFYASIEQRDRPELAGRAVVVGGLGRRGVVSTASYEARRFGVHSALPTAIARRRCPHAIFLSPRMDRYAQVAQQVHEVFARYTPLVEPLSLDEAFLDVTASRLVLGDGEAIARAIQRDVLAATALSVSIGVAACKSVAKVASDLRKPRGLVVVPPGTEAAFLAPLPVARLWGAGKVTQARLAELGLATIGDVQRMGRAALVAALGAHAGEHYDALAHGRDPRPVEPDGEARSISRETTFAQDVADDARLLAVLMALAESVGSRLRAAGLRARTVRLKLRYPPFETLLRQTRVEATDDDAVIYASARRLLEANRPAGRPVRLLGVGTSDLVARAGGRQTGLFERAPAGEAINRTLDAIRARFGGDAVRHATARPPSAAGPYGPERSSGLDTDPEP